MVTCLEHGLLTVLTGLAVDSLFRYFDKKDKKYILAAFLLIFLSVSLYESSILYFIISSLFIVMLNLINRENNANNENNECEKNFKGIFWYIILIPAISFIANNIIVYSFLKNKNQLKMVDFNYYDYSSFTAFIQSLYHNCLEFLRGFQHTLNYNFGSIMVVSSAFIFLLLIIYFSLRKRNILIFISGIIMLLLPFTPFIVSSNYNLPYRVYSTYGFVNAITFVLLYLVLKKYKVISKILLAVVFLIILQQSKEMNQFFYYEHLKCENDKFFAHSLMSDLTELNLDEKPILFAGLRKNPESRYLYDEAGEEVVSIFNWDRYDDAFAEIFVRRGIRYLRELGYNNVTSITETDIFRDKKSYNDVIYSLKNNVKDMPVYPMKGSIKDMDSYIIVKIGPSLWEEK